MNNNNNNNNMNNNNGQMATPRGPIGTPMGMINTPRGAMMPPPYNRMPQHAASATGAPMHQYAMATPRPVQHYASATGPIGGTDLNMSAISHGTSTSGGQTPQQERAQLQEIYVQQQQQQQQQQHQQQPGLQQNVGRFPQQQGFNGNYTPMQQQTPRGVPLHPYGRFASAFQHPTGAPTPGSAAPPPPRFASAAGPAMHGQQQQGIYQAPPDEPMSSAGAGPFAQQMHQAIAMHQQNQGGQGGQGQQHMQGAGGAAMRTPGFGMSLAPSFGFPQQAQYGQGQGQGHRHRHGGHHHRYQRY
jgi:hypothetical protein